MTSPDPTVILDELAHFRARVRLLIWIGGLARIASVLFGSLCLAGFLDWLIHFDDPGLRVLVGGTIAAACGWILWRFLIAPLRESLSGAILAARLEQRYPVLRGRLVSAVEFVQNGFSSAAGAPGLQQVVVADALSRLPEIELSQVVETREVRRMTLLGAVVCTVTLIVVLLNPQAAATAMTRLLLPFSSHPWPRTHNLALLRPSLELVEHDPLDPLRVAQGEPVELYVQNLNGRLPDRVWLEIREPHREDVRREPLRKLTLRNSADQPIAVAAINLTVPAAGIEFRATGGDDDTMPFYGVEVVPPPVIESLQVTVDPPAYSGRTLEQLPLDVGNFEGLVGSHVRAVVRVNKPLRSAALHWNDAPPETLKLSTDGREFVAEFVVREPGLNHYWFDLQDRQGFANRDGLRYEARGVADLVPEVVIEDPPGDVQVTADAELPLRILAKDDLGLTRVALSYQLEGADEPVEIPLVSDAAGEDQVRPEFLWKLADLSLQPGGRLQFRAIATDRYDLGEPHIGRSVPRQLTVVSTEQKQQEIVGRLSDLLDQLRGAIQVQQRAETQLGDVQHRFGSEGKLEPQDRDLLQRVELDQRQVSTKLGQPDDGVQARAARLQEELNANRIDDPETGRRLQELELRLDQLGREQLPGIERDLTQSRKAASAESLSADQKRELTTSLDRARREQQDTLESLQSLESQLSEWRDRRDVDAELSAIKTDQQSLKRLTAELAERTLARPMADLSQQDQADLKDLTDRQRRAADRLDQFQRRLEQLSRKLAAGEPETAETFENLEQSLQDQATAGRMREAAAALSQNQLGRAGERQQQTLSDLQDLEKLLNDQPPDDIELMVKKTEEVAKDLEQMQQRLTELQQGLRQSIEDKTPPEKLDQLRKEVREIARQAERMERQLERLQLKRPEETAERLRRQVEQAAESLETLQPQEAMESVDRSLDLIEQTRREVAEDRRQLAEQLAREQLETIASELESLQKRQQSALDETVRLATEHSSRGNWTRGQLRSLKDLTDNQSRLQAETEKLTEQLSAAEVFALTLRAAAKLQHQATERLAERDVGERTQSRQQRTLVRLQQLLKVLADSQNLPGEGESAGGGESGAGDDSPQQAGPPGESLPQLAQLKLLRTLQEACLERTADLDRRRGPDGTLPPELIAERDDLASEQAELADLMVDLLSRLMQVAPARSDQPTEPADGKGVQ